MELYPHQTSNIKSLLVSLERYGAALDASDLGTGKTLTAVGLCKRVGAQPAVVCPMATIPSWRRACADLGVTPLFITNYEQMKTKGFPYGELTVTRTPNRNDPTKTNKRVKYALKNIPARTIFIFDEVQRCRAKASENSKILLEVVSQCKTLMLSATPFTQPTEAFSIGYALKLFSHDGYFSWTLRHGVRRNRFGRFEFQGGVEDMEAIHAQIFPDRGVRTRREEIPNFPQTQIITRAIETGAGDEIAQVYLEALAANEQKDIERAREGVSEDLWEFVEPLAITKGLRARQKAELLKVPIMAQMAQDAIDKGNSVPVFLNFDASIDLFRRYFPTDSIVSGNMSYYKTNTSRYRIIDNFQQNRHSLILVNAQAGGAGLNLHDPVNKKPRHALISPPWSAITLRQILGRSHRSEGGWSTQEVLFAAGTIEERVLKRLNERLDNLDALTDGDLDPLKSITQ